MNPKFICMITPSRWMTKTAQGIPDKWVDDMISCNKIEVLHDFQNANDCFPGVEIKGGVSYFLWNRDYLGKCKYHYHYPGSSEIEYRYDYLDSTQSGIVIRDPKSYNILEKIVKVEDRYYIDSKNNFSGLVSPKHFFDNGVLLTSNWHDYKQTKDKVHSIKYYISKAMNGISFGWISINQIPKNQNTVTLNKVYIPAAAGTGTDSQIIGYPIYGEPNSVCSQTYLVIGFDSNRHNFTKDECQNIMKYIRTKFFRYLVSIKKKTQNGPRGVYQFVPLLDFKTPLTDQDLYKKYSFSEDEIGFIENSITPMESI
jgi:site-specific DNA-methyltransferase (adenine-specific)